MKDYQPQNCLEERDTCMCCGRKIMLLDDLQSMLLFLGEPSVKQRGCRCMNCGQVACKECSIRTGHCSCGSNAWVALPYLDKTIAQAFALRSKSAHA